MEQPLANWLLGRNQGTSTSTGLVGGCRGWEGDTGDDMGMLGLGGGPQGPAHLDVQVQLLPEVVVQGGHLALQALVLSSAVRQGLGGKDVGG